MLKLITITEVKAGDISSTPGLERSTGGGNGSPTPVSLLGKSHGQRSLAGYSPWGRTELDTTEVTSCTQEYILNI